METTAFMVQGLKTFSSEQSQSELKLSQLKFLHVPELNVLDFDHIDIMILNMFLENLSFVYPILVCELRGKNISLNYETIRKRLDLKYLPRNLIYKIKGSNPMTYHLNDSAEQPIKKLIKDFTVMIGISKVLV